MDDTADLAVPARTSSSRPGLRLTCREPDPDPDCCSLVDPTDFTRVADALALVPPVAVAVSGGGDSIALLRLVQQWSLAFDDGDGVGSVGDGVERGEEQGGLAAWLSATRSRSPLVTAITVDHGFRAEAASEADWVAGEARAIGIAHVTLRIDGPGGKGATANNVQAQARAARYAAMEAWCRDHGVPTLLTGHTQDDQAETVLMRLIRGSGVDGLSGIPQRLVLRDPGGRPSVEVLRPLLGMSRCALRRTLQASGQAWIEDPSNEDERFTRVRVRRLLEAFAAEGLTAGRLAATAQRMGRARSALEQASQTLMSDTVTWHRAGFAWIGVDELLRAPEDVGLRALSHVIQGVGGLAYPPRHDRLVRLAESLRQSRLDRVRTLGHCRIAPVAQGGVLMFVRENRNLPKPLPLPAGAFKTWDGRFQVSVPKGGVSGEVRPLGAGMSQVFPERRSAARFSLPQSVRLTLPALWCGTKVIAVPHLGFDPEKTGFRAIFQNDDVNLPCHLDASYGHSA